MTTKYQGDRKARIRVISVYAQGLNHADKSVLLKLAAKKIDPQELDIMLDRAFSCVCGYPLYHSPRSKPPVNGHKVKDTDGTFSDIGRKIMEERAYNKA